MDFINATSPKHPAFPLIQIDLENWDLDLMIELFLFDEFYKSEDQEFYYSYIFNKRFIDSDGRIFLAKDREKINTFWSKVGIFKKYKINFEATAEKWDFNQVKNFLLAKVGELSAEEGREEWIKFLHKAKTIKQLIEAER